MIYFIGLVTVLAISIGLGLPSKNYFLVFGLTIVVMSSFAVIVLAIKNSVQGARAQKLMYEDFLPDVDEGQSHSFKYTALITGVKVKSPEERLQLQIDELQKVAIQDEKTFLQNIQLTNRRIDICLAQIRFHENVNLPKILGQGAGLIILSAILTIIGSAYLAFPDFAYKLFSDVTASLINLYK